MQEAARKINFKKLRKLMMIINISLPLFLISGCKNGINQPHKLPPSLEPITRYDFSYWQKQKQQLQTDIAEFDTIIAEIKVTKDQYESETEYQEWLKQTQIEHQLKKAELNECDYQILRIENKSGFNNDQIQTTIALLTAKLDNLNHALTLIATINDSDFDLQDVTTKLKTDIQITTSTINELIQKNIEK